MLGLTNLPKSHRIKENLFHNHICLIFCISIEQSFDTNSEIEKILYEINLTLGKKSTPSLLHWNFHLYFCKFHLFHCNFHLFHCNFHLFYCDFHLFQSHFFIFCCDFNLFRCDFHLTVTDCIDNLRHFKNCPLI